MSSTPQPLTTIDSPTRRFTTYATRRPWPEFSHLSSITRPYSLSEAKSRILQNLNYFRVNYTLIILLILFFSLLWHPISLIVFLIIFAAWFYLYFFRDGPLVLFNRIVDDRIVLAVLAVVTIVALVLSQSVWLNVLVALLIGGFVVLVHAAFRRTEDLYLDDVEENRLRSFVGYSRV